MQEQQLRQRSGLARQALIKTEQHKVETEDKEEEDEEDEEDEEGEAAEQTAGDRSG